jgi:2,4-dienoyl-CoA reductase-like NADH-dependent reductase (Old Yellow Enzyme family)
MELEHVFTPLDVGPIRVPNRIVRTGHALRYFHDIKDEFIAHHETLARGGLGLAILENAQIHPASTFHPWEIIVDDDRIIPGYQRLMERLSRYEMRVVQLLVHYGKGNAPRGGGPSWSPSPIPRRTMPMSGDHAPIEMTQAMIDTVVEAFASATRRMQEGGLHGVEIKATHGDLVQQFLSPLFNQRTDAYGGSPENRLRFAKEVLAAVRAAAGPKLAVGLLISSEDSVSGGLEVADVVEIARALEATGDLDYLNIAIGDASKPHLTVGGTEVPHGYQLEKSVPIAQAVKLPAIVVGRIMNLEEAERIIASGQAEMVALMRAQIAEPAMVRKTREGKTAEIRPCIACNHGCYAPIRTGQVSTCTVNPSAGYELTLGEELIVKADEPKRVLVVGGGPAGLEAARVAALRGHRVTLFESEPELGGQLRLVRRAPNREEFGLIVDWHAAELARLGVDIRSGVTADASLIAAERPQLVILATGATPRRDGFQALLPLHPVEGAEAAYVHTGWEVLEGKAAVGESVVVLDDLGHYEAIAIVDHLLGFGARRIAWVTRFGTLAPLVELAAASAPARARFGQRDFHFHPNSQLVSVAGSKATVKDFESERVVEFPIDSAVLLSGYLSRRELPEALNAGGDWVNDGGLLRSVGGELRLVGDAVTSPRYLTAAIREGHLAARFG